ncbi:hypothetical protein QAD02_010535 [Eretmocerus hayati]|uniref:Uncharacterized protein n=1 Tax=Eretmocerus hayati TaxID=131215 RepID=A0ACC2NWT7_9HYME|nr:hypothetical protein QAD02_010535 [Eretmocerus hayati]
MSLATNRPPNMQIVNSTSFLTINRNIKFEPEKVKNGTQLAIKQHVRDVTELKHSNGSFSIQAEIVRQTSISTTPSKVQLHSSEKCKHIYSVIHFVNHHQAVSKADYSQEWGKPTPLQFAKENYSKGNYASKLFGKDNRPFIFAKSPKFVPYPNPQLSELFGRSGIPVGLLMKQARLKLQRNECEVVVDNILLHAGELQIYHQSVVLDKHLQKYYNEKIAMTREEIISLSRDTFKQSDSDLWFAARRPRVSASKGAHSIKTRDKKTAESLASDMLVQRKLDTPATRYEKANEQKAKDWYTSLHDGYILEDVGVILSPKQPWLCASLDSVVIDQDKWLIIKCAEVECPITCKNLPIVDWVNQVSNVPYLHFVNNRLKLRESSLYFTQCQVQMYLTGLSECDLSSGKGVPICERFYFDSSFPKIYCRVYKKLPLIDLNEEFKDIRKFSGNDVRNLIWNHFNLCQN